MLDIVRIESMNCGVNFEHTNNFHLISNHAALFLFPTRQNILKPNFSTSLSVRGQDRQDWAGTTLMERGVMWYGG